MNFIKTFILIIGLAFITSCAHNKGHHHGADAKKCSKQCKLKKKKSCCSKRKEVKKCDGQCKIKKEQAKASKCGAQCKLKLSKKS